MEEDDKIILDVVVNDDDAEDAIKGINAVTNQLLKTNGDLLLINRELEKQGKANSDQFKANQQQIEANERAVKKNSAEVNTLSQSLKGQKESATQSKEAMASFSGVLDKLVPGLGGVVSGLGSATKASLAFIATPLGIILAGIAGALALVTNWVSRTNEGMDLFEDVSTVVSTALDVLLDNLDILFIQFQVLGKFLQGDFSGGIALVGERISALTAEIVGEADAALKLNAILRTLEDRQIDLDVAQSESVNTIKQLIIQAKNRNLTEAETKDILQQAFDLETKLAKERIDIATGQLQATAQTAGATKNLYQQQGESAADYAKRLIASHELVDEERDKVVEGLKKYNEANGQSLALQEKLINQIDAETEKEKAKAAAKVEAAFKMIEAEMAYQAYLDQKAIADQAKREKDYIDYVADQQARADALLKINEQVDQEMVASNAAEQAEADKNLAKDQQREAKKQALAKATATNKVQLELMATTTIMGLLDQSSDAYRIAAIIQTSISTYAAAQKAYESQLLPGDPTSIFRAVAAAVFSVIQGLGRVAQIGKFEEGGDVFKTIGGKSHSQGGTKFWGEDGTRFEAERGEGLFILKRNAHASLISDLSRRNQMHGGRSWYADAGPNHFALGGNVIPFSVGSQGAVDTAQLLDLVVATVSSLPAPRVAVDDINTGQNRRSQVTVAAEF